MGNQNETLVRTLYQAFATGDMAAADSLLADDIVWHAPGRAQHAGIRRGKAELFATLGRLAQLTNGTLASELHDVLANDKHAVVLQQTHGSREDRLPLSDHEVLVFRIRDGKVAEVWEHPEDLYAMDTFFA